MREICHLNAAWNAKAEKEMTHQRGSPPHLKANTHQEIARGCWVLTLIPLQPSGRKYSASGFCSVSPSSHRIRPFSLSELIHSSALFLSPHPTQCSPLVQRQNVTSLQRHALGTDSKKGVVFMRDVLIVAKIKQP